MSFLLSPARRPTGIAALTTVTKRTFTSSRPSQLARMTIIGRLGSDPELQVTKSGADLIKYAVATAHGPKDNRETSWFRISNFPGNSKSKDFMMGLQKGTLVYLEGDASMRAYDDAEGKRQTKLTLVQTKVEVLKRPSQSDERSEAHSESS